MTEELFRKEFFGHEARTKALLQEQSNRAYGELEAIHGALRAIRTDLERLKPVRPWWRFWRAE